MTRNGKPAKKPPGRPRIIADARRLTINFDSALLGQLVSIASREKRHVSELIREAVGEWVERRKRRKR